MGLEHMALPEPSLDPPWTPTLDPPRSFCFVLELLGLPPGYPGALPGHPRAAGRSQAAPPGLAPRWTGPQLDFPREKIQNREAILNFFEFVAFEAGHPYHPGKAPGRPGRAWEGMKRNFQV